MSPFLYISINDNQITLVILAASVISVVSAISAASVILIVSAISAVSVISAASAISVVSAISAASAILVASVISAALVISAVSMTSLIPSGFYVVRIRTGIRTSTPLISIVIIRIIASLYKSPRF